jgi:hypothetical protein
MCCNCFEVFFSGIFVSVLDACFKYFICLEAMLQVLYLDISKVDRVFASLSSLSTASPWCLIAFCCLASFSDCGEGAAMDGERGAAMDGEGGALGAGGRDAPVYCSADTSTRYPFSGC